MRLLPTVTSFSLVSAIRTAATVPPFLQLFTCSYSTVPYQCTSDDFTCSYLQCVLLALTSSFSHCSYLRCCHLHRMFLPSSYLRYFSYLFLNCLCFYYFIRFLTCSYLRNIAQLLLPPIFFPPRILNESERKEREQMKK